MPTNASSSAAPALLASNLFSLESSVHTPPPYNTGIATLDSALPPSLWTAHKVIAVITSPSLPSSQSTLPAHLIATHLSSSSPTINNDNPPIVYIIAPPTTATALPSRIHALLSSQRKKPQHHPTTALTLLDSVALMQYLDIAGLSEALAEVSSSLDSDKQDRAIVLIEGLGSVLEGVQRRSGLVQACALGAGLVRSIAHLSRGREGVLVLLSLESGSAREGEDVGSAFSREGTGAMPGWGLLGKVILGGVDTAVLVHDGRGGGEVVVEVVKDRVIGGLGYWAVWKDG